MDWYAAFIALLLAADSFLLIRRFSRRRNWLIFSAMMPRLYLAIMYLSVAMGRLSLTDRVMYLRFALVFLLLVEIVNHIVTWNNDHV